MTDDVANNDRRARYTATYVGQKTFDIDFPIDDESDVNVYRNGDLQTITTDYTVDVDALTVTFTGAGVDEDDDIIIEGATDPVRETAYSRNGALLTALLNGDMRKVFYILQEILTGQARRLSLAPDEASGVSAVLPLKEAGKALIWGASGIVNSTQDLTDLDDAITAAQAARAAAETAQAGAEAAEDAAAAYVDDLTGTSSTSLAIAVASKTFSTQAGKFFDPGSFVLATSDADPSNYMHGQVTSYSGGTLIVNVTATGGSGTHADWTIRASSPRGAAGAPGAPGAGSGDMLAANNLSDLVDAGTARGNLGLGSAAVADTGTANGNVPVLDADGWIDAAVIPDTAVTPGSYTAADITVDAAGRITSAANGSGSGKVVGYGYASTGSYDSTTTVIPQDDTVPTSSEGKQCLSLSYTPSNASNILLIEAQANISLSSGASAIIALFKDSVSTAMAVACGAGGGNIIETPYICHKMVAGGTSAITFKLRFGTNGTTAYLNGTSVSGGRNFGGVLNTFLRVTELTP